MRNPKLRDSNKRITSELYPLGEIPKDIIYDIGKWFAYDYYVGNNDISGDRWGDIFSHAIKGEHLGSPIGLADVVKNKMAWSAKTVKSTNPHSTSKIRIISGRCSPDFSYGITDPHEDIQQTGTAVLSIYNERINIARDHYEQLRSIVLVRNFESFEFSMFEQEINRYVTSEYRWVANSKGNLEGFHQSSDIKSFTWQPHGSQFTVHHDVPLSSVKFKVKIPSRLDFQSAINHIGFDAKWIEII